MNKENNEVYQYHSGLNIIYKEFNSEFFQLIIEKENEIQLENSNEENIKELAGLYKKAIENYSGISNEKVIFYNNKLTKLLMVVQKNKKKKIQNHLIGHNMLINIRNIQIKLCYFLN